MPIDRVEVSKVCDYIPFVSTISNMSDIFAKAAIAGQEDIIRPLNDRYITYVEDKSWFRCVILLVPVLGNLIVGIYDLSKKLFMHDKSMDLSTAESFHEIPWGQKFKYLENYGYTKDLIYNNEENADQILHQLTRSIYFGEIRHLVSDYSEEIQFLSNLRKMPPEVVKELIVKISTSPEHGYHKALLMFLLLDPKVSFENPMNYVVSELVQKMIRSDKNLKARLSPLIMD